MPRKFAQLVFIIFIFIMISGCGYHIAGKGGEMPGGVKELTIPVFVNATSKPDIEATLTAAFVSEFVNTVEVVDDADSLMQGTIVSYTLTPISYSKDDVNQEYRLTVVIALVVRDKETGKIHWAEGDITDYEDYTVNIADVNATKEMEAAALRKLSKDTARLVKERMLEGF